MVRDHTQDPGRPVTEAGAESPQPRPMSRKAWETPDLEELLVQHSATRSGVGRDGGVRAPDCTLT
jgi:hypothetical protein